jgi:hypothetical protein
MGIKLVLYLCNLIVELAILALIDPYKNSLLRDSEK